MNPSPADIGSLVTVARAALEALFSQPAGGMAVQHQAAAPRPRWDPAAIGQLLQRLRQPGQAQ